jgi:hypothetical protein
MSRRAVSFRRVELFWAAAAVIFAVRQCLILGVVLRLVPPGRRLGAFLFGRLGTGRSVAVALIGAGVVVLAAEVLARLVLGPLVRWWVSPRVDGSTASFHLEPTERVLATTPARHKPSAGGRWAAGTLVRTDRRAWFFPDAWDGLPWSVRLGEPVAARRVAPPSRYCGLVGVPDRLAVRAVGEGEELFAVADPEAVLAWFRAPAPAVATSRH